MRKKLIVSLIVLLIAGLLGVFVAQNTSIPLWIKDTGYRVALSLEKDYPMIDVWNISSDGEFIYVAVLWLEIPEDDLVMEIADTIDGFIASYKTTEQRVIFSHVIEDDGIYWAISMFSCPAEPFGTGRPILCEMYPWSLEVRPEDFPWVGR